MDKHENWRTLRPANADPAASAPVTVSVVAPCYNESENLIEFHRRLAVAMESAGLAWEWVAIDDHSSDDTWPIIERLAAGSRQVRGLRLSKNHGAHMAVACGLDHTEGDCTVIIASDLQHPPELLPEMVEQWRRGARIVWAIRSNRDPVSWLHRSLAKVYYAITRRIGSLGNFPPSGADFVLIDRRVVGTIRSCRERNLSLFPLIAWTGFDEATVRFEKKPRVAGKSGWTLMKKINIALDTFYAFSNFPVRAMSSLGLLTAMLGFLYAADIIYSAFFGNPVEGWSSLIVAVLLTSGLIMMMLGVLGEYLWRTLDEARGRPRYIVEESAGPVSSSSDAPERAAPALPQAVNARDVR